MHLLQAAIQGNEIPNEMQAGRGFNKYEWEK